MGEEERQRVVVRRANVLEVDVDPVDLGDELIEPVEQRLAGPPVVLLRPVGRDVPHVLEGDSLRPVVDDLRVAPPGVAQAGVQVVEVAVRDRHRERADRVAHGSDRTCDKV